MSGHFKLLQKINLSEINEETKLPESDYSLLTNDGHFLQFKFERKEIRYAKYDAKPGIWKIVKSSGGMFLQPTTFVNDKILEELCETQEIEACIDAFFNNLQMYKEEFGIEIPKRNVLLWGPPGTGKTTNIAKCVKKYAADNKTLIITWDTNVVESFEVKAFISSFVYTDGIEKIIVVAEDIGGIENAGQPMRTDSSLLSLLDNSDKTFGLPVMVIATTNHPSNLAEAIANRSGRFDDKIEVSAPSGKMRRTLLEFFSKGAASKDALDLIESKDCEKFPPAHIKDVWIRSRLRNKDLLICIKEIQKEIRMYNDAFEKRSKLGM